MNVKPKTKLIQIDIIILSKSKLTCSLLGLQAFSLLKLIEI